MGLEAGALQLGGARKRSHKEEEGIRGIPVSSHQQNTHCNTKETSGIFTNHRLTRKSEGKATGNKMPGGVNVGCMNGYTQSLWLYVENTNLMLTQYSMTNGVTFPC